jgi:homoprotocatechuate degradation regulator HpaR
MPRVRNAPARARNLAAQGRTAASRMPPFSRSLPMLLLWVREELMRRFRQSMRVHGLTDQQWRVIRALTETESLEIVELGARCCLHPASLSRILPKLAAVGIVSRRPNAEDQRRVIVSLTPRGWRLFESAIPTSERIYDQVARDVGPERLEHAYAVLEELVALLAKPRTVSKTASKTSARPAPAARATRPRRRGTSTPAAERMR